MRRGDNYPFSPYAGPFTAEYLILMDQQDLSLLRNSNDAASAMLKSDIHRPSPASYDEIPANTVMNGINFINYLLLNIR